MRRISRWLTAAACLPLASVMAGAAGATTESSPWAPAPGVTWQWQIVGSVDTSLDVQMYDIDLFDARPKQVNGGVIDQLHADGSTVVCYLDTGAWESIGPMLTSSRTQ